MPNPFERPPGRPETVWVTCPDCKGDGKKDGKTCSRCGGKGQIKNP